MSTRGKSVGLAASGGPVETPGHDSRVHPVAPGHVGVATVASIATGQAACH